MQVFAVEACVSYNRAVTDVSERGAHWQVTDDRAASSETFDCVVLTMPVPQVLGLSGSIQDVIGKYWACLVAYRMSLVSTGPVW